MAGLLGPLAMIIGFLVAALVGGPIIVLCAVRTPKLGTLTIIGILMGIYLIIHGYPFYVPMFAAAVGLCADLIVVSNRRSTSSWKLPLAYAVFSLWQFAPFLSIFVSADAYFDNMSRQMGADYAATAHALLTPGLLVAWLLALFACAVAGGFLGQAALRRHFARAGLA